MGSTGEGKRRRVMLLGEYDDRYRTIVSTISHLKSTDEIKMACSMQANMCTNLPTSAAIERSASRKAFLLQPCCHRYAEAMHHDEGGRGYHRDLPLRCTLRLLGYSQGKKGNLSPKVTVGEVKVRCYPDFGGGGVTPVSPAGEAIAVYPGRPPTLPIGTEALRELLFQTVKPMACK